MRIKLIDAPSAVSFLISIQSIKKNLRVAATFVTDEPDVLTIIFSSVKQDENNKDAFWFSGKDFSERELHGWFNTEIHSGWIEFEP